MTEEDWDRAHETLELYQNLVIGIGRHLIESLPPEGQEYVIVKMHDEFRFWRLKG